MRGPVRRTPIWILVLVFAAAYAAPQQGMRLLRGKEVGPEDVAVYGAFGVAVGFPLWVRHRRPRIQKLLDQFPEEESVWR